MSSPRHRVLLVEDEPLNVRFSAALLIRLGSEVLTATSGREAVALLQHERVDFVLLDLGLPDMRGQRVARQLRKLGITTPIHALTAEDEAHADLDPAEFDGYLSKPLREDDLARIFFAAAPVVAVPPPACVPLLDLAGLRERVCGDEALVQELLADFVGITGGLVDDVRKAFVAEDRIRLKATAHRLTGALLAIGATNASVSARTLEGAAREGALPELHAMLEVVAADVDAAREAARPA